RSRVEDILAIFRQRFLAPHDPPPAGVVHLVKDDEKEDDEDFNADAILEPVWAVVGITPGGVYGMLKKKWPKAIFGQELCDLLVGEEAWQMTVPGDLWAGLALKQKSQLIVVGDPGQMPPIVNPVWDTEPRRTFRQYQVYASLFDTLRLQQPPMIQFAESFRLYEGGRTWKMQSPTRCWPMIRLVVVERPPGASVLEPRKLRRLSRSVCYFFR